jgi:hypothetical protein
LQPGIGATGWRVETRSISEARRDRVRAAAMIMPNVTESALWGSAATAVIGVVFVILREKGE